MWNAKSEAFQMLINLFINFLKNCVFRHVISYLDATFLWVAWMLLFSNCFFPKQLPWKPFLPLLFLFFCLTKYSFWSSWDKIDSLTDFFLSHPSHEAILSLGHAHRWHPKSPDATRLLSLVHLLSWLGLDLILDKAWTWKIIPRLLGI